MRPTGVDEYGWEGLNAYRGGAEGEAPGYGSPVPALGLSNRRYIPVGRPSTEARGFWPAMSVAAGPPWCFLRIRRRATVCILRGTKGPCPPLGLRSLWFCSEQDPKSGRLPLWVFVHS